MKPRHITRVARTAIRDERGAGIVEYALMAGLIAMVASVSVSAVGNAATDNFETVAASYSSQGGGSGSTPTTTGEGAPTTTIAPTSTTTTTAGGGGGGTGGGGLGTTTTTTTIPPTTTTTTTVPDYPTVTDGVKGKVLVTFGFVDDKVTLVKADHAGWDMETVSEKDNKIKLEFTDEETGEQILIDGWVTKKGDLKTKVKVKKPKDK
ncbi:MAG: hypothetical protein R2823_10135 [Acidimicrobiia bacterium]